MTIIFALLAAFCNALNVTAQHLGSLSSPEKSTGWRFVVHLLRNPLWLFGWAALAGGFVFQALALHAGQMSVVQPLLITIGSMCAAAVVLTRTAPATMSPPPAVADPSPVS